MVPWWPSTTDRDLAKSRQLLARHAREHGPAAKHHDGAECSRKSGKLFIVPIETIS
jgi:hypothetical protein